MRQFCRNAALWGYVRVPFYIAAPTQTLDPECPDGSRIPIEERASSELTHFQGCQVAAPGIQVRSGLCHAFTEVGRLERCCGTCASGRRTVFAGVRALPHSACDLFLTEYVHSSLSSFKQSPMLPPVGRICLHELAADGGRIANLLSGLRRCGTRGLM